MKTYRKRTVDEFLKPKSLNLLLIVLVLFCFVLTSCSQKKKSFSFSYWTKDAESLTLLQNYVEEVTDNKNANYIPEEDRIAVFDLDGTLYSEKTPYYAIWQTFVHRALNDPSYTAPDDVREIATEISQLKQDSSIPSDFELREAEAEAKAFAGMTLSEYYSYVKDFLNNDAEGFSNLKLADAFFLPMIEVINYLQENGFQTYICSGTDRFWVRAAIDGKINIPVNQIIGMDVTLKASNQNDADGLDYTYVYEDEMIRGDTLLIKNVKMNKVTQMAQEIGRQPVLAFGNSSGDSSMCAYVMDDNPYKSMAFMVLADDLEREYGNESKAEKMKATCEELGWQTISMKNDWTTIFGDEVSKNQ